MKKVILTVGLPASGKTIWAKALMAKHPGMYKRVNKDELRALLDDGRWSKDNEKMVLKMRDQIILESLRIGKHVIVDDTNLHPKHVEQIKQLTKGKAEVTIQDFTDVSVENCIKRDIHRLNSVGQKVIMDMYNQFLKPKPEVIEYDTELPDAIIVDIDGTLAHSEHRSPFDWNRVGEDRLDKGVNEVVCAMEERGYTIIVLSGRDSACLDITEDWLKKAKVPYDHIYMRAEGDIRKDSIVKKELFDDNIKGKYNIRFVLDDRLSVCRMWYDLGLTLLRVGNPDADF